MKRVLVIIIFSCPRCDNNKDLFIDVRNETNVLFCGECGHQIEFLSTNRYNLAKRYIDLINIHYPINLKEILNTVKSATAYIGDKYYDSYYAYGLRLKINEENINFSGTYSKIGAPSRLAGEVRAIIKAMEYCVAYDIQNLTIHYRSDSLVKWLDGSIKSNEKLVSNYINVYNCNKSKINISFLKVGEKNKNLKAVREMASKADHKKEVSEPITKNKEKVSDKFFAVLIGRKPGIYLTEEEKDAQIIGCSKPVWKRCQTKKDAEQFISQKLSKKQQVWLDECAIDVKKN